MAPSEELATRTRTAGLALAAILVVALALRVAYTLQARSNPYFLDPQVDQGFWLDWGRAIARGEPHGEGPFPRAPLYAFWLGGLLRAFGERLLVLRLVQDALGTLGVAGVYLLGRRVFDARAALWAALLAATSWVLVYYDNELLRAGPSVPLVAFGLVLALRLDERPSAGRALAAGAVWGLFALLRPQVLAFVPVLLVWLAWRQRGAGRALMRELALVLAGVLLPILPASAYNLFAGGDLVLVSPEAGTVLWNGNHPEADGVTSVPPGVRGGFREHLADLHAQAQQAAGRPLRPSEVSRHYARRTLAAARDDPGRALGLLGRKALLFWSDWEYGNPEEPRFFARRFAPVVRFLPLGFGALAALAAAGAAAALRTRNAAAGLLLTFVLTYTATVVLFLVGSRYRVPVLPVLAVFAGHGLVSLADALRARRFARFAAGLAVAVLAWLVTQAAPVPRDASEANGLWWLGLAEARAGRHGEAIELYRAALAQREDFCYLHASLGHSQRALGDPEAAVASLERAVELCPLDVAALDALAALYRQAGRLGRARELAERSVAHAPHLADGWFTLGRVEFDQGNSVGAYAAFERAYRNDPEHFNAAFSYGVLALQAGRFEAGAEALERVVRSTREVPDETRRRAYAALLAALERGGRADEARALERELGGRFPQ